MLLYQKIKVVIVQFLVRKNFLLFKLLQFSHYLKYTPKRSEHLSVEAKKILNQLKKDGVVVIPGFFDDNICNKILKETQNAIKSIKNNTYNQTSFYSSPEQGIYRIKEIDKVSNMSQAFFNNPLIYDIAKAYVDSNVKPYQKMLEIRPHPGKINKADSYHFDDWRIRFKSFLYLVDVDEYTAPFVYLKGSHGYGNWRSKKEFEYYKDGKHGRYGKYFNSEVNHICDIFGFEEKICSGKKGTLILVDTRGLHRGTPLITGERVLLAQYFDIRDFVSDAGTFVLLKK